MAAAEEKYVPAYASLPPGRYYALGITDDKINQNEIIKLEVAEKNTSDKEITKFRV